MNDTFFAKWIFQKFSQKWFHVFHDPISTPINPSGSIRNRVAVAILSNPSRSYQTAQTFVEVPKMGVPLNRPFVWWIFHETIRLLMYSHLWKPPHGEIHQYYYLL